MPGSPIRSTTSMTRQVSPSLGSPLKSSPPRLVLSRKSPSTMEPDDEDEGEKKTKKEEGETIPLVDFLSGAAVAAVTKVVLFPLENFVLLRQLNASRSSGSSSAGSMVEPRLLYHGLAFACFDT